MTKEAGFDAARTLPTENLKSDLNSERGKNVRRKFSERLRRGELYFRVIFPHDSSPPACAKPYYIYTYLTSHLQSLLIFVSLVRVGSCVLYKLFNRAVKALIVKRFKDATNEHPFISLYSSPYLLRKATLAFITLNVSYSLKHIHTLYR